MRDDDVAGNIVQDPTSGLPPAPSAPPSAPPSSSMSSSSSSSPSASPAPPACSSASPVPFLILRRRLRPLDPASFRLPCSTSTAFRSRSLSALAASAS